MGQPTLVTLFVPTYNGAPWIKEALASALAQSYTHFELLVTDDASTDETVALVRQISDPRIRIVTAEKNLGLVGNWNRGIQLAHGGLVKFLFQDDRLEPRCLERLVPLFTQNPHLGMAFTPRSILLEQPGDPGARAWRECFATLHHRFEGLAEVNSGRLLFDQWARAGFRDNWVGEPSCVMVRRSCFERLGGFNSRMYQGVDFEMWIRLMYFYDVGFIDEPLAEFRFHASSATLSNHRAYRPWLDMLWLLEGLLSYPEIRASHPELARLRLLEAARTVKMTLRRIKYRLPVDLLHQARTLGQYLKFRSLAAAGKAPSLHGLGSDGRFMPTSVPSSGEQISSARELPT